MKIESFEIRFEQFLEVVCNKTIICYNLKKLSPWVEMSIDKKTVWFYMENSGDLRPDKLEADFDLTPIKMAWEI